MTPISPNGIDSWIQTHFLIVQHLVTTYNKPGSLSMRYTDHNGYHALIPLAVVFANEFEEETKGRKWKGDYFDTFDEFIEKKEKL
ncbi:MAG: hypothetical protein IM569_13695 [Chitinophagaceae bacterium]|jgi:hypothetical protein|nr:hypothetical protein [Chitinophagaceae bacterium]MCA6513903.1 hypothetical protein [Chitinophagaceae bacterium]